MAKTTTTSIEQALQHNAQILDAWRSWFTANKFVGDPDAALRKLQPALWRAFCRSSQAQQLGVTLPPYDASTRQDPAPVAPPIPDPGAPPLPCSKQPILPPVAVPDPAPVAPPVPAPDPQPIPQPVPAPVSNNPLLALIAQGLEDMGFKASPSVSQESIAALVQDAVHAAMAQYQGPVSTIRIETSDADPVSVTGHVPTWFARLCKLHAARVPALLVGPAGSGKTTAAAKLAEVAGVPFYRLSMAAGTDESEFTGRLLPIGDNMRFEYCLSLLTKAYTEGGVFLADDIDLADPNLLGLMNAALDGGGWYISARYQDPFLEQHPDFYLVAAANTHGHGADRQYVGAQQLDERTLSRFRMGQINCDYDADLEKQIFPGDVLEIGHTLRTRCRALPGWTRDISTRDMASVTKLARVMPVTEAWYGYFADWSEQECSKVHVMLDHDTQAIEVL